MKPQLLPSMKGLLTPHSSQEKVDDAQLKGHRGAGEASHKEEEVEGGGILGESKGSTNSSGGTRRAFWEVLGTLSQNGRIKASIVEVEVRRSEVHWSLVRLATSEPVSGPHWPMNQSGRSCGRGWPRLGGVKVNVLSFHQGRSGKL